MDRFSRGHDDGPRTVRALLERPPSVKEKGWSEAVLALFDADPRAGVGAGAGIGQPARWPSPGGRWA